MKMKWWCTLTVILIVGAALVWRIYDDPVITRENFEVLKTGMTQAEVERILGGARNECHDPVMAWAPRGDTLNSMRLDPGFATNGVLFKEDRPPAATVDSIFVAADFPEGSYELVWLSESILIAVLFDRDGRLLEKHVSDVQVLERPTPLDWLRAKL
jgi:hypothetical protein